MFYDIKCNCYVSVKFLYNALCFDLAKHTILICVYFAGLF